MKAWQNHFLERLLVRRPEQARREVAERYQLFAVLLGPLAASAGQERQDLGREAAQERLSLSVQRRQVTPTDAAVLQLVRQVTLVQPSQLWLGDDLAHVAQDEAADGLGEATE